jgi:hypothetical protein
MTSQQPKITNIRTTKLLIVSSEIEFAYVYKHNHNYQFTKEWRCFNLLTDTEVKLVMPNGRCLGYNINRKFVSLTKIKQNVDKIKTHKVRATADDVFVLVSKRFNVSIVELKGKSRQNDLDLARQILAMLLYEFVVRSKKVVSALMNRKSMDSTFELIEKGQSQLNIDKVLANHYYSIKEQLEK